MYEKFFFCDGVLQMISVSCKMKQKHRDGFASRHGRLEPLAAEPFTGRFGDARALSGSPPQAWRNEKRAASVSSFKIGIA